MWTQETMRKLLMTNDRAVERAVIVIYNRQTVDEKESKTTQHHNGLGFSSAHARYGTYIAKWIISGNKLTGQHLEKSRNMMLHYIKQLIEIANRKNV